jgi:hypothetical protein
VREKLRARSVGVLVYGRAVVGTKKANRELLTEGQKVTLKRFIIVSTTP